MELLPWMGKDIQISIKLSSISVSQPNHYR